MQPAACGEYTEKYSRGRRGAPAKGVGRLYRRESSNLSFSAKKDTRYCIRFVLITLYLVSFAFYSIFVPLIIPLAEFYALIFSKYDCIRAALSFFIFSET